MRKEMNYPMKAMIYFLEYWNQEAYEYQYTMPDGFRVRFKVFDTIRKEVSFLGKNYFVNAKENKPIPDGRCLSANMVHSLDALIVREILYRSSITPERKQQLLSFKGAKRMSPEVKKLYELWQRYGFLSAKILHLVDENSAGFFGDAYTQMVEALPEKNFDVLPIHDCFRVLPKYGNDLRKMMIEICVNLTQSNVYDLAQEITGVPFDKCLAPQESRAKLISGIKSSEYIIC